MMNFFDPFYQTLVSNPKFGLCDDGEGGRAYVDTDSQLSWIATVENPEELHIEFTAIDKGVLRDEEQCGFGRCDGMLTQDLKQLVFVELKDQRGSWIPHAVQQLEDTVKQFKTTHPDQWDTFRDKRAYACNKSHPQFKFSHAGEMQRFFATYKVRLLIEATMHL